jgi:hypothetical protein
MEAWRAASIGPFLERRYSFKSNLVVDSTARALENAGLGAGAKADAAGTAINARKRLKLSFMVEKDEQGYNVEIDARNVENDEKVEVNVLGVTPV